MQHIVTLSFGISSWAAGKLVVARYGAEKTRLIFTDTNYEDEDTYRWGEAAAENIGAPLVRIADGRDIWEVFRDERMLGNTRADPCSKILKRRMLTDWLAENCDPDDTIVHFGIHWSEADRFSRQDARTGEWKGILHRMEALGWTASAPLCEPPLLGYQEIHDWAKQQGLWQQRLYEFGFPHANCGGRCVKQGQQGWAHLFKVMPERYLECERKEEEVRQHLGKDVAILRDRRGGRTRPLTLLEFRQRLQKGTAPDDEWGGCACFAGDE